MDTLNGKICLLLLFSLLSSPCRRVGEILAVRQVRLLLHNFLAKDVQSEDFVTNITLSDAATYFLLVWHIY